MRPLCILGQLSIASWYLRRSVRLIRDRQYEPLGVALAVAYVWGSEGLSCLCVVRRLELL